MDQIAFFFRENYIYWSSVLLLVAATVAVLVKNPSTAIENLRRAAVQPVVRR